MVTPLMKTLNGIINFDSILLAEANPNEGNTSAQTPNLDAQEPSPSSTSPEGPENSDSKIYAMQEFGMQPPLSFLIMICGHGVIIVVHPEVRRMTVQRRQSKDVSKPVRVAGCLI